VTQELPAKSGTHAAKHGRKVARQEIDGSDVTITFGPEVVKAMKNLLTLFNADEKFDYGVTAQLESLIRGKLPINKALTKLVMVGDGVQEREKEINEPIAGRSPGNYDLRNAFGSIIDQLDGDTRTPDREPVMVQVAPKVKSR
jgi:hypothetical protein